MKEKGNKYNIHPDLRILQKIKVKSYPPFTIKLANIILNISKFFVLFNLDFKSKKHLIKTYQNGRILVVHYKFKKRKQIKKPLLIYYHGGGFQMEASVLQLNNVLNIARKCGFDLLYVRYRLMPKFPFPYGLEDCYESLLWADKNENILNHNKKYYLIGESAGGNLCLGVSLLSRDRLGPKIEKQILLYPVVSMKQDTKSMTDFYDTPMWNSTLNKAMWESYIKNKDDEMVKYASFDLVNLDKLPPTYIETADFDCLRDEGIKLYEQLKNINNDVCHNQTKGTVHGYDVLRKKPLVKAMIEKRIQFIDK